MTADSRRSIKAVMHGLQDGLRTLQYRTAMHHQGAAQWHQARHVPTSARLPRLPYRQSHGQRAVLRLSAVLYDSTPSYPAEVHPCEPDGLVKLPEVT